MIKLDYSQHKCPYPVVETRKQMLANPDSPLTVLVSDQAGRDNVSRLAEKMGYTATASAAGTGFSLNLTPTGSEAEKIEQAQTQESQPPGANGGTVVYCGSDRMGQGDDEFGRILMRNYITTQLEMDPLPQAILFVNSGINLTTEGSEVLEALEKLSDKGVDLASCGLCLEFYEKKDQLRVGRVTNMYDIADLMNSAERVAAP